MQTLVPALRLDTQDAYDDGVGGRRSGLHALSTAEEHSSVNPGQVVYVCFPVLVPGDDCRVIPFGKYALTVSHQDGPLSTTPAEVVLASLDNGTRVALSVQELMAIARDPDVEII